MSATVVGRKGYLVKEAEEKDSEIGEPLEPSSVMSVCVCLCGFPFYSHFPYILVHLMENKRVNKFI